MCSERAYETGVPIEHGKVGDRKISARRKYYSLTSRIEQVETREILHSRAHPLVGAFAAALALVCPYMVAKAVRRNGIIARATYKYAIV
jgi:hypothetical protein